MPSYASKPFGKGAWTIDDKKQKPEKEDDPAEEQYNYMGPLQKNEIPKFCGIYSKNNNPHNNPKAQEFRKNLFKKLGSLK